MVFVDPATPVAPSNISAVPRLVSEIVAAGDVLSKASGATLAPRMELLAKARDLVRSLESPRDVMIQQLWAHASRECSQDEVLKLTKFQPTNVMAISFGVEAGLWTTMVKNGDGPQKVVDLAKQLGVEEELLQRMMRHIAGAGYLDMTAPDEYTPNTFSKSLALPLISAGYQVGLPVIYPLCQEAPTWLKNRGYRVPTDKYDTVYQMAHKTKQHWFEHIQTHPENGPAFNNHMAGYLLGRPPWMEDDFYPAKERLIKGFDAENKDAVMFVDIAGGFGHYTEQFRSKFPDVPGRLIVQDLPVVIDQVQGLHPRIEKMGYDFLTEQPVKGARTYFTHFVLHDWPDETCVKIAGRIRDAMKPGYSRFLIKEYVVPAMGHEFEQTALDIMMMVGFASKERTAAQWSELLEKKCGLKIVNIWTKINGIESVIECERPA